MQKKGKTAAIAIALILTLSMIISLVPLPTVLGYTGHKKAYAYIGATPNPVAINEEVLLHVGISQPLDITEDKWYGLLIYVTHPDGTKETLGPFATDSTGGTGTIFVPAMEGTYKLQTYFPAQWYNKTNNVYYEEDYSDILDLVVGAEPSQYWPGVPLPTEYWNRPIDSQNREWASISGHWLSPASYGGAQVTGQDDAPDSAHVLWQKQLVIGGLGGGDGLSEPAAIFPGDAYEGKFSNSLVIMGILIYVKFDTVGGANVDNWICAVDIHTGETLWEKELLNEAGQRLFPQYGQVMFWKSYNTQGVYAYLFCGTGSGMFSAGSTTLEAFDPYTGRWLFRYTNMPSGTRTYGPNGEILIYTLNQQKGYMTMWNSTAVISAYWGTDQNNPAFGSWQPQGKTIDAQAAVPVTSATPFGYNGFTRNVTIPIGLPGSVSYVFHDDTVVGYQRLGTTGMFSTETLNDAPFILWAIDAKTGSLKFNKTIAAPSGNVSLSVAAGSAEDRLVAIWCKELTKFYTYNIDTGNFAWETPSQHYLDIFAMYPRFAYGKLYSNGMSGIMYAYDAKTGDLAWNYTYTDPWAETLWSDYWSSLRPRVIADGKIYLGQSEHSVNQPQPRGAPFVCLNATTGEVIWSIAGMLRQTDWGGSAVMGDSIIATMDTYNQMIYAVGKGPSATTVSTPDMGVPFGTSVLIKGMVTDVSPGTDDIVLQKRFPNGLPAVADESMSEWMLYVYKEFERPSDAKGVDVTISVLDANGNFRDIGTATSSSMDGFYSFSWTPDIPGEYKVYARFAGSAAYYPSHAESAFTVDEAQPTPTEQPQISLPPIELYVVGMGVAIIIAVAIAALLIIRKRP